MDRNPDTASPIGKPRTRPFSIRLTDEEKSLLLRRAGNLPLGAYVRTLLLAQDELSYRPRQRRAKTPVKDHEALARVLAALGQSRIANNLNQIAKAVNISVLPMTPETEHDIREARAAIAMMRRYLISALGLVDGDPR